jgi:hypothetical protein
VTHKAAMEQQDPVTFNGLFTLPFEVLVTLVSDFIHPCDRAPLRATSTILMNIVDACGNKRETDHANKASHISPTSFQVTNANLHLWRWYIWALSEKEVSIKFKNARLIGAASRNDVVNLRLLKTWGAIDFDSAMAAAASCGKIAAIEWCKDQGATNLNWAMASAAANDRVAAMEWCKNQGETTFKVSMAIAVKHGRIAAMEWCKNQGDTDFNWLMIRAANFGQVAAMEWCKEQGATVFEAAIFSAAENNHVTTMARLQQWVDEAGLI